MLGRCTASQIADGQIGVARQFGQGPSSFAAHGDRLEREYDTKFAEQTADAIEGGGALFDESLANPMQTQLRLLRHGFDGHEAHLGPLHRLADGGSIGGVVLTAFAGQTIRSNELGCDQSHRVSVLLKQACPVVRTGAGLHTDRARREADDEFKQPGPWHDRANQHCLAVRIDPMNGEHRLGKIDTDVENSHGLPLPSELMRFATPSWHFAAVRRNARLARDGEVPFIR
jgi:hypothetical protein